MKRVFQRRSHQVLLFLFLIFAVFPGCNSSVEEAVDIIDGIPRRTIDTSRLGVNAFVNDGRFGSIEDQFLEVRDTLGLNFVRVLFQWDSNSQPTPGSSLNFGFTDAIIDSIPQGVDALVILTGLPNWMGDSANWVNGSPRETFVERYVRPIVNRYRSSSRIIGFQVWNEPNMPGTFANTTMGFEGTEGAVNYVELLARASNIIRDRAPGKQVVNAATTAIAQNFPGTLEYNRAMRDAGVFEFIDVFAIHYYGKQYENLVRPGGVRDFLNSVPHPIWLTESGELGVNNQLAYGEEVWPYLLEQIPSLTRIYVYQFTDASGPDSYGMRNLSRDRPVSDLYVHLRERASQ